MSSLIITMAGESRRFREAGFTEPKYRLRAHDRTLFSWSFESLRSFVEAGWSPVFVGRTSDASLREFIRQELDDFGSPGFELISLDEPTDGQATTAMCAGPALKRDEPTIIYNIDTYVSPLVLPASAWTGDGWVPCFPGAGDGWSFLGVGDGDIVTEVREKVRISTHCTVGLYAFGAFDLFADAYERQHERVGDAEQSERYIAPLYNTLIADGRTVLKHCLPSGSVVPLGTPKEVDVFSATAL